MGERLLWTPPGPMEELLALGELMQIKDVVQGVRPLFDSASPELQTEGRQAADALVDMVEKEIKERLAEVRRKRRSTV